MIALHALYQIHIEGKTIGSAAEDKAQSHRIRACLRRSK